MLHHLQGKAPQCQCSDSQSQHCASIQPCTRSCKRPLHWCIALRLLADCPTADMHAVTRHPVADAELLFCCPRHMHPYWQHNCQWVHQKHAGSLSVGGPYLGSSVQNQSHHSPGEEGFSACASHPHCMNKHTACWLETFYEGCESCCHMLLDSCSMQQARVCSATLAGTGVVALLQVNANSPHGEQSLVPCITETHKRHEFDHIKRIQS